jgi:menaquinone-dependent protoporphyrinogen oxidase
MARVALLYGTTEGQTGIIAERMAAVLDDAGHDPALFHAGHLPADFSLSDYEAVVIGASVHVGSHQKYVARFVADHVDELNRLPSAFFSVSLTAATGTEEAWATARSMLEDFLAKTGWEPDATAVVPGALKYSQYGTLKRFVMKRIAKRAGGGTDTSQDYEYTDWDEVESFAAAFADALD